MSTRRWPNRLRTTASLRVDVVEIFAGPQSVAVISKDRNSLLHLVSDSGCTGGVV